MIIGACLLSSEESLLLYSRARLCPSRSRISVQREAKSFWNCSVLMVRSERDWVFVLVIGGFGILRENSMMAWSKRKVSNVGGERSRQVFEDVMTRSRVWHIVHTLVFLKSGLPFLCDV